MGPIYFFNQKCIKDDACRQMKGRRGQEATSLLGKALNNKGF